MGDDRRASWDDMVGAALLGAERRRPPGGSVAALLDAAAVETVRRRAGARPAPAPPAPEPAPHDPRPPLPPAAADRLTTLLARHSSGSGRRGPRPDLAELLPQWLAAANAHGYRAPEEQLPELLDAARARTDLRQQAILFGGPRARWLAGLNPDWAFVLRSRPGTLPGPEETPDTALWEEGLFAERVALLAVLRQRDAAAGRELLADGWAAERAEDRLMFLDTLRETLCPADEPFLARALTDRSRSVRATAAELLAALPGSALAARMAERAVTHVYPMRTSHGVSIAVEPPQECDAGMQRDGMTQPPASGRGERAWWLGQIVDSTPLSTWYDVFDGRSAAQIVALPVAEGWGEELHAAWCRAAVRQRDVAWARALAGEPAGSAGRGPADLARLLSVLPPEERSAWAAGFIASHGLSEAFRVLSVCAVPWSGELGRAVLDALEIARDAGSYPWSFSGVMGLAERCLDPAEAERLAPLTAIPDEPTDGSPGAGGYWAESFQRLVVTLSVRAAMFAELAVESPAPAGPDHVSDSAGASAAREGAAPEAGRLHASG